MSTHYSRRGAPASQEEVDAAIVIENGRSVDSVFENGSSVDSVFENGRSVDSETNAESDPSQLAKPSSSALISPTTGSFSLCRF